MPIVWMLPCLSQEFSDGPVLRSSGDHLAIAYDFENESGEYTWAEIVFSGVSAFFFTAARHCREDQVAAYDKLLEIDDSKWASSLVNAPTGTRHFRIFFDDVGCYEVLAAAFDPNPPSEVVRP